MLKMTIQISQGFVLSSVICHSQCSVKFYAGSDPIKNSKVKFSDLSVSGGVVNLYNALKAAEEIAKNKK